MMNRHGLLAIFIATMVLRSLAAAQDRGVEGVENTLPTSDFGTYRAVIIGIDDYQSWQDLDFAEQDARELAEILIDLYGFESEQVVTLLGSEATESKIMRSLRDVLQTASENDNVLIFYAGHGQWFPFDETGYWIPVDGDVNNDTTWISFRDIVALIEADQGRARKVVVVTDSCYGGAMLSTRSGRMPGLGEPSDNYKLYLEQLRDVAGARSRQVVSSGGNEPVPDQSLFARLLKKALRENTYPYVDLRFLLNRKIQAEWPIHESAPRLADLGEQRGEFVFVRSGEVVDPPPPGGVIDAPPPSLAGEVELAFWNSIRDSDNAELYKEYLRRFPGGHFVMIARDRLEALDLVVVPVLAGMNNQAAEEALENVGLAVGAIATRNSESPRGTVLDQVPAAGSSVKRGTSVEVTLATWPSVPDVVGRSVAEAVEALTSEGFQIQRAYASARAIADAQKLGRGRPGTVIRQQPGAGDEVQPKAEVSVFVAGAIIPKLLGLDVRSAAAALEKANLRLGDRKAAAVKSRREVGTVLKQSVAAGTVVAPGTVVALTYGKASDVPSSRPRLVAPRQGATLDNGCRDRSNPMSWDFDWEDVSGASQYHLNVIRSGASNPVVNDSSLTTSSHRQQSRAYVTGANLSGWRWKVRALVAGSWSPWSEERTFNVEPLDTDCASRPDPQNVCAGLVQGKIAWDYKGTKRWATGNLNRLCKATSRPSEPGRCFERVMHGGINWGGGTRWEWTNAVDLCEGTDNAARTIACFQDQTRGGRRWQDAIQACSK